jgi:hypothetical protein
MNTNQLLHISGEIIVLLSFTYFLQRQITRLSKAYNDLSKRVDEMETEYKNKFDTLLQLVDNIDRQLSMNNHIPESFFNPRMNNMNSGLRNRKAKSSNDIPNDNNTNNTNNTNKNIKQNFVSQPQMQPQQQMQSQPQMQPQQQMQSQPQMQSHFPNFAFNPMDLLNSISGIQSPPVFTATIVTENIIPKKSDSEVKIVEVVDDEENNKEENLDEEIADELNDLLSNNNEDETKEE